jgi:hypothetical protein
VDVTFQTVPSGLTLNVNSTAIVAPQTVTSWEGYELRLDAEGQTDATGQSWAFASWSDGGAAAHTAITPSSPVGYTATFTPACATRSSGYSAAVLATPGLVGYWRLGESAGSVACDSAGANDGSYQAGTTLAQPGALADDPDTATAFNGSSGWVQVPHGDSLNVGDRFSIEAWVKRGSIGTAANQVIASQQNSAWVLMFNTNNQLVLRRSNLGDIAASTATVTDTSRWHHVVATKDGATVKLYLDGTDVTGPVSNQTITNNTLPLAIGQSSNIAYFNGQIDEVALYNTPLTPAQVANHHAYGG